MSVDITLNDMETGLPEGSVIVNAVVILECLSPDGETMMARRKTLGLANWTASGLALAASDAYRDDTRRSWQAGYEKPPDG